MKKIMIRQFGFEIFDLFFYFFHENFVFANREEIQKRKFYKFNQNFSIFDSLENFYQKNNITRGSLFSTPFFAVQKNFLFFSSNFFFHTKKIFFAPGNYFLG